MAEFVALVLLLVLYFLPTIVGKNKRNAGPIFLLNLLGGWTVFGWLAALIWAASKDTPPATVVVQQAASAPIPAAAPARPVASEEALKSFAPVRPVEPAPRQMDMAAIAAPVIKPAMPNTMDELERLFQLKEKGALTEEEYIVHKAKLLA